jgi:4-hydroxybenzoate polyprenyltransferase
VNKAALVLWSSRPLSWINTAFPFALAYYVTTETVDAALVVGFLFFLVPYNLLMYGINDVFDYESDVRNPRKGGVEGALLTPDLHRTMIIVAALAPVPFLVPLVAWGSLAATGVLALALFFVVAYSAKGFRFKEIPLVDSVTSSAHFVMPAIYGLVLGGASLGLLMIALLAAFFLWGWRLMLLEPFRTWWLIERRGLPLLPPLLAPKEPCGWLWRSMALRVSLWR